jgi:hypothetical protein
MILCAKGRCPRRLRATGVVLGVMEIWEGRGGGWAVRREKV